MLRRQKPTRIELKRSDVEEYEQKAREIAMNLGRKDSLEPLESLPSTAAQRQAEIHNRIGYKPQSVPSDGASNIHF